MTMLSTNYTLEKNQIADFEKNGHIFLENVLPLDELKPYREAIRTWAVDFKKNQIDFYILWPNIFQLYTWDIQANHIHHFYTKLYYLL